MNDIKENEWQINIDGKMVSQSQLMRAWRFYQEMQINSGDSCCPLCGCDFDYNDLFVCNECGNLLSIDEKCTEHYDVDICKDCCEKCSKEKAYEEAINAKIDEMRGK